MWSIIATWHMASPGVQAGAQALARGVPASQALVQAIKVTEADPNFTSVGYGGLPNREGIMECDAAYMDGQTLQIGAVGGVRQVAHPIELAYALSQRSVNNFLVGPGAQAYAETLGLEMKNLLAPAARQSYLEKKDQIPQDQLSAYDGHDTVGMIVRDDQGQLVVGTSTSGLFMKDPGRVGDSPLSGSGFYVDQTKGAATATGLGEDLMKGCVSYRIVDLMDQGLSPQDACQEVVYSLDQRLRQIRQGTDQEVGDLSVIAMNPQGEWGYATNIQTFSLVQADSANPQATSYRITQDDQGHWTHVPASQEWRKAHAD